MLSDNMGWIMDYAKYCVVSRLTEDESIWDIAERIRGAEILRMVLYSVNPRVEKEH